MVEIAYSPDRGDIVWISLDPTLGRELQKRRPALILTPKAYNLKTSLALIVPITSKVILSDQIRSTDEVVMVNLFQDFRSFAIAILNSRGISTGTGSITSTLVSIIFSDLDLMTSVSVTNFCWDY